MPSPRDQSKASLLVGGSRSIWYLYRKRVWLTVWCSLTSWTCSGSTYMQVDGSL